MDELKGVLISILVALFLAFAFFAAMDREVARQDYIKNVELCKPIDGCLFNWNCNHYNKMIERTCND